MVSRSFAFARSERRSLQPRLPRIRPCSTERLTGSMRKSWRSAATTSGRLSRTSWRICRWMRRTSPSTRSPTGFQRIRQSTSSASRSPATPTPRFAWASSALRAVRPNWIKVPFKPGDDYIPRFGWVDHKTVWVETLTRDHKHLNLYFADASNGQSRPVLEQEPILCFLTRNMNVLVKDRQVILTSWMDGHTHIYLYSFDGNNPMGAPLKLERQLTRGDFEVSSVLGVDQTRKVIYYASNEGNPMEEQLWQVSFNGERMALTGATGSQSGSHSGEFRSQRRYLHRPLLQSHHAHHHEPVRRSRRLSCLLVDGCDEALPT